MFIFLGKIELKWWFQESGDIDKKIGKEKWFKGFIEGGSGLLKLLVLDLGTFVLLTLLSKPLLFWATFYSIHREQNGAQDSSRLLNKVSRTNVPWSNTTSFSNLKAPYINPLNHFLFVIFSKPKPVGEAMCPVNPVGRF